MAKTRPIWQELPEMFKRDVVGRLDFKSRCCLSTCSKADKQLVEDVPFYIKLVKFYVEDIDSWHLGSTRYNDILLQHQRHKQDIPMNRRVQVSRSKILIEINKSVVHDFEIIDLFIRIFKHRKTRIGELEFSSTDEDGTLRQFVINFIKVCGNQSNFRIRSRKFRWSYYTSNGDEISRVLKLFDRNYLRELKNEMKLKNSSCEKIVRTTQWKYLKNLTCSVANFNIDDVLHLQQLKIINEKFTTEDIWKLIKSFCVRDLPRLSYFQHDGRTKTHPLESFTSLFDVIPTREEIDNGLLSTKEYVHIFPTSSNNYVLVCRFRGRYTSGVVCLQSCYMRDFRKVFI